MERTFDLMQFWLPLIGTLIGATVALTSLWLKEWFDRRRELQKLYEQYYIVDGIDKIYAWLLIHKVKIRHIPYNYDIDSLKSIPIPVESIARIDFLLRDELFSNVIYDIECAIRGIESSQRMDSFPFKASQLTVDLVESSVREIDHYLSAASDLRLRLMLYKVKSKVSLVHLSLWLMKWYREEFLPKSKEQLKQVNVLGEKLALIGVLKLKEENVLLEKLLEIMDNPNCVDSAELKQQMDNEIRAWLANRKTVDDYAQIIDKNGSA